MGTTIPKNEGNVGSHHPWYHWYHFYSFLIFPLRIPPKYFPIFFSMFPYIFPLYFPIYIYIYIYICFPYQFPMYFPYKFPLFPWYHWGIPFPSRHSSLLASALASLRRSCASQLFRRSWSLQKSFQDGPLLGGSLTWNLKITS